MPGTSTTPESRRTAGRNRDWCLPALDNDRALVAGVASGIAAELGVPASWIRTSFVLLFAIDGWGALVYGGLWAFLLWARLADIAPVRTGPVPGRGRSSGHRFLSIALITAGLAIAGLSLAPFGPVAGIGVGLVIVGLGLAWRTSSTAQAALPGRARIHQLLGGVGLVVGGLFILLTSFEPLATGTFVVGAVLIALVGTIVVSGPWLYQVLRDFDSERQARIRSDERAEVAAHLHDSVLQTLALIQKVEDRQAAINLARRQERELRNWLDPGRASRLGGSIRGRLDQMASDVEELHGIPVEVVTVGDVLVDEPIIALLNATREACVNAARHSGTKRIDVFAEVDDDDVTLFVRDTGDGFDPTTVDPDRRGLRESIVGRMERAGGGAMIYSEPGQGTEVELTIPRSALEPSKGAAVISAETSPPSREDRSQ